MSGFLSSVQALWFLGTGHMSRKNILFKSINIFIIIYVILFDKVIILSLLLQEKAYEVFCTAFVLGGRRYFLE